MEKELIIYQLKEGESITDVWKRLKDPSGGPVPPIIQDSELDMSAIYFYGSLSNFILKVKNGSLHLSRISEGSNNNSELEHLGEDLKYRLDQF